MKTILIVIGGYLPGYKFGGPVQTIKNLTDSLGTEYDFRILTLDRDYGEDVPYSNIGYNQWNEVGAAKVWYAPPREFRSALIMRLAEEVELIYVCGCFGDYARAIMRLKSRGRLKVPVVIASMGMLSPGAFHIKYFKKKSFVTVGKVLGWFRGIIWSVTDEKEKSDVEHVLGNNTICRIARNIPRRIERKPEPTSKEQGSLRIVFISRISPKKNLDYALQMVKKLRGEILFDIYGVMEDRAYYQNCEKMIKEMPPNVRCMYKGAVPSEEVLSVLQGYHVFLFPTKSENFGHVIYEAMAAGCLPVISDRTAWNDIERQGAGRLLHLENMQEDTQILQTFVDMDGDEYRKCHKVMADYIWNYWQNVNCEGYIEILNT